MIRHIFNVGTLTSVVMMSQTSWRDIVWRVLGEISMGSQVQHIHMEIPVLYGIMTSWRVMTWHFASPGPITAYVPLWDGCGKYRSSLEVTQVLSGTAGLLQTSTHWHKFASTKIHYFESLLPFCRWMEFRGELERYHEYQTSAWIYAQTAYNCARSISCCSIRK